MEIIVQIAIILFSCGSIYLFAQKGSYRRWGYIVGLAGQPFWFYATWINVQWGMFLCTIWFSGCHILGIWNYWIKEASDETH